MITAEALIADCVASLFGRPIIENVFRGKLVEVLVGLALRGHGWHPQDAWAGWDFQHEGGTRLEVKQAAARQTWDVTRTINRLIGFDIKARTGEYNATGWVRFDMPRRCAEIYVFAHHPRQDDTADHREPTQWEFYVVPTAKLPHFKTLSLARLRVLATSVPIGELATAVAEALQ